MPYALNNVTTGDGFGNAQTLRCPRGRRISIDVHNAAVYFEFGTGELGVVWDGTEQYLTPTFRSMDRRVDAIRVRSAVAGKPAQVTVLVAAEGEL
jgi:hypothetical protein